MPNTSLLMHNTMRISEGRLDEFRAAIERAVTFVEEQGPQVMLHWRLSDPYIRDVMEHCTVEHLTLYGDPDDDVRQGIAQVTRTVLPRMAGFVRPLQGAAPRSGA